MCIQKKKGYFLCCYRRVGRTVTDTEEKKGY